MRHVVLLVFTLISISVFSACSSNDKVAEPVIPDEELPAETLYERGMEAVEQGRYRNAIKSFDLIDTYHPYSKWAAQGLLMTGYAHYKVEEFGEAIAAFDRFIKLYPSRNEIAHAYYLRSLCFYDQITDIRRDQLTTQEALQAFNEIIARFPDSDYARNVRVKKDLVLDHLAGKEIEIGRFYQQKRKYIAAISRFREVIEKYDTTSHAPEALHRLVEVYLALGITHEARSAAVVLGHNYPDSKWYRYSYKLLEGKKPTASRDGSTPWYKKLF